MYLYIDSPLSPVPQLFGFMIFRSSTTFVSLTPIASAFDLTIIYAPPIFYQPVPTTAPVLVCGHSFELNATSDLDFYISIQQVSLAAHVFHSNLDAPMKFWRQSTPAKANQVQQVPVRSTAPRTTSNQHMHDSGVEFDQSTAHTVVSPVPHLQHAAMATIRETRTNSNEALTSERLQCDGASDKRNADVTPFNVLLTAGRISLCVYKHEQVREAETSDVTQRTSSDVDAESSRRRRRSRSRVTRSRTFESETKADTKTSQRLHKLLPLLYMHFAQPHTLVKFEAHAQKADLSCYDLVLRGASTSDVIVDYISTVPDVTDFSVHWLDTKPGRPHPKTGVLPSLYSLHVTDFMTSSADVELRIERPVSFSMSVWKLEQIMSVIKDVQCATLEDWSQAEVEVLTDDQVEVVSGSSSVMTGVLPRLRSAKLSTEHISVSLESPDTDALLLSLTSFESDVTLATDSVTSRVNDVKLLAAFNRILIQTTLSSRTRSFVGPLSCQVTGFSSWEGEETAKSTLAVDVGIIPVDLGQGHIVCVLKIQEQLQAFFAGKRAEHKLQLALLYYIYSLLLYYQSLGPREDSSLQAVKQKKCSTKPVQVGDIVTSRSSQDDLRSGLLSYVALESKFQVGVLNSQSK